MRNGPQTRKDDEVFFCFFWPHVVVKLGGELVPVVPRDPDWVQVGVDPEVRRGFAVIAWRPGYTAGLEWPLVGRGPEARCDTRCDTRQGATQGKA